MTWFLVTRRLLRMEAEQFPRSYWPRWEFGKETGQLPLETWIWKKNIARSLKFTALLQMMDLWFNNPSL